MQAGLSRNHHTVPEFFLRRFLEPGEQKLNEYFKPRGEWRRTSPSSATVDRDANLYGYSEDELSDDFEKEFSRIETLVSPVIANVSRDRPPSEYEREGLASFVSLQLLRGRMMRAVWSNAKAAYERPESSLRILDECKEKLITEFGIEEYESRRREILESGKGLRLPTGFGLDHLPRMHPRLGAVLSRMEWRLEIAAQGEHFVVSDNPVVPTSRFRHDADWVFALCREDLGIEVTCPLDPRTCLVCSWENRFKWSVRASKTRVQEINRRTAFAALKSVYGGKISSHSRAIIEQVRTRVLRVL